MRYVPNVLPYNGCKFDLLKDILKIITAGAYTINDVFGGSGCFAINAKHLFPESTVRYNEMDRNVWDIIEGLKIDSPQGNRDIIEYAMAVYELNDTDESAYLKYRDDVNTWRTGKDWNPIHDVVLTRHAFSSTPRWNLKGVYNEPFGARMWNFNDQSMRELELNHKILQGVDLFHHSFDAFLDDHPPENDTLPTIDYYDPPYLITKANYNRGWCDDTENRLYKTIDERVEKGVSFILSNVIEHRGESNDILKAWMQKYNVRILDKHYAISRDSSESNKTIEVIVSNMEIPMPADLSDFF